MELGCLSFWPQFLPYAAHLIVIISVIATITVTFNAVLIYSLFKTKQTQSNAFRFIIVMSTSDFLHGALVMPAVAVAISIRGEYRSCLFDQITNYGFYLFGYFSYFMVMCIAFDRLYQLCKSRPLASSLTARQAKCLIAVCLAVAVAGAYVCVVFISFKFQLSLLVINACLISSVYISYTLVLRKVKVHNLHVKKSLANSNHVGSVNLRIDNKLTKIIWALLATLVVTYIPFNITTPWLSYLKYQKKVVPGAGISLATMWAYVFIFAYCFINAFIFMYGNRRVKRLLQGKFQRLTRYRGESSVVPIARVM